MGRRFCFIQIKKNPTETFGLNYLFNNNRCHKRKALTAIASSTVAMASPAADNLIVHLKH
jgi:hypothetical protein